MSDEVRSDIDQMKLLQDFAAACHVAKTRGDLDEAYAKIVRPVAEKLDGDTERLIEHIASKNLRIMMMAG